METVLWLLFQFIQRVFPAIISIPLAIRAANFLPGNRVIATVASFLVGYEIIYVGISVLIETTFCVFGRSTTAYNRDRLKSQSAIADCLAEPETDPLRKLSLQVDVQHGEDFAGKIRSMWKSGAIKFHINDSAPDYDKCRRLLPYKYIFPVLFFGKASNCMLIAVVFLTVSWHWPVILIGFPMWIGAQQGLGKSDVQDIVSYAMENEEFLSLVLRQDVLKWDSCG